MPGLPYLDGFRTYVIKDRSTMMAAFRVGHIKDYRSRGGGMTPSQWISLIRLSPAPRLSKTSPSTARRGIPTTGGHHGLIRGATGCQPRHRRQAALAVAERGGRHGRVARFTQRSHHPSERLLQTARPPPAQGSGYSRSQEAALRGRLSQRVDHSSYSVAPSRNTRTWHFCQGPACPR